MQMNNVDLFGAFTLLLTLAMWNFGYEWTSGGDYMKALEHTYSQMWALLLAWFVWREPQEKPQRPGQGPGWCD
jgi:hypothetical protein